jgi:hypothetical protein
MAYLSRTVTAANGVTAAFAVSFPLRGGSAGRTEVDVFVHALGSGDTGVAKIVGVDYNWTSDGLITFIAGHIPANGQVVDIRRNTLDTALTKTLQPGGSLKSAELVANDLQLLYLAEEAEDAAQDLQTQAATNATNLLTETAARIAGDNAVEADLAIEREVRGAADASILNNQLRILAGGTIPVEQVVITPEAFGAVRYDPLNEVDATAGLQDFFRAFQSASFARQYIGDWSGDWKVTAGIKAAYDGFEPNVTRKFRMGNLRVPPVASLPGAVPIDVVLDIAGYGMQWEGEAGCYPTGADRRDPAFRPYYSRPFKKGFRLRAVANGTYGDFKGQCARRHVLQFHSAPSNGFTLDGIVFPTSQNEAVHIGAVNGVYIGSSDRGYEATALIASAKTQGKTSSGTGVTYTAAEVFVADTAGQGGTFTQRTQLTVPSTADLEIYDMLKCRLELTAAIYGTIAADNATKAFIWSAGDPTNLDGAGHGLQVGDLYPMFVNGANANKSFRIVAFGGVNNRTITVTNMADGSGPATIAASADPSYNHNGKWSWHYVTCVNDATHVALYPWVPDRINSAFHIVHGSVLQTNGGDLANSSIEKVIANASAASAHLNGLYLPKVGTILGQSTTIGIRLQDPPDNSGAGIVVAHAHIGNVDGCDFPVIDGSGGGTVGRIQAVSAFTLSECLSITARAQTNDQLMGNATFGHVELSFNGYTLEAQSGRFDTLAPTTIDNTKFNRQQIVMNDDAALTVNYDRDEWRLFVGHNWAEILWCDSDGTSPDGTLTLNMHPALIDLGWAFAGAITGTTGNFTAMVKSQVIKLIYIPANKKIAVIRLSGS